MAFVVIFLILVGLTSEVSGALKRSNETCQSIVYNVQTVHNMHQSRCCPGSASSVRALDDIKLQLAALQTKQSEEVAALKARLQELESRQMTTLQTRVQAINVVKPAAIVGFHVARSRNLMNALTNVEFDSIINHYGNCWNSTTNMFVAPVTGFYSFQMTIMNQNTDQSWAVIMHGNKELQRAFCAPHGIWHQSSAAAVVKVNKGETVYVRLLSGKLHSNINKWIHFVGFLVHQI